MRSEPTSGGVGCSLSQELEVIAVGARDMERGDPRAGDVPEGSLELVQAGEGVGEGVKHFRPGGSA